MASNTKSDEAPTPASSGSQGMAPSTTWEPSSVVTPRKRRRRIRRAALAALAAAYVIGAAYFSTHFTPGTTVDGVDASLMTTGQLQDALESQAASCTQRIVDENGFETTVRAADVQLSYDGANVVDEARSRFNPFLWLGYCLSPQHLLIDGNVQINEQQLSQVVNEAVSSYNDQAEPPTNAAAHYDKKEGAFVTTSESTGTALDAEKVAKASQVAFRSLSTLVEVDEKALEQPELPEDDKKLQDVVDEANDILSKEIELQAGGCAIETIDKDTMASWMTIDDNSELVIDGVFKWIENNQAVKDAGNAIDDEHVWALDEQGTCDAIHEAMDNHTGGPVEIVRVALETKPPVTPGAKERGRHIDINLSTQFVRFYDTDGTVIWDSYCVTGGWDVQFGQMHYTPEGTYAIQAKETNRTLVGADTDGNGEPDYESFVYYWMPFLNYDYGLHDATWRYEDGFGGDVYTYYGSHGCVNLPYSKAEQLFNLVNVGDEVYIHY